MGTRHLQRVINVKGETKVSQYGQWDGYPDGQGLGILQFLREVNLDEFSKKVDGLKFSTEEDEKEVQDFLKSIGSENGWMTVEQSEKFQQKYYFLSRNCGSEIYDLIMKDEVRFLTNCENTDWVEWFYTINLQDRTLTAEGWGMKETFSIDELPTDEEFVTALTEKEEE